MKMILSTIISFAVFLTISGQQISLSNNCYRGSDVLEKKQVTLKGFDLNSKNGVWSLEDAEFSKANCKAEYTMETDALMAEKYYSISPYAYCANNPINAIDMNGDTISYYYDGTRYVYKKNRNESGFYNKDGYPLDRPFVNALSKSLKSIQEGKTGNELLDYLISSITEININMGDDNETKYINGHVIVNWNPDDDQGAGVDEYGGYRSPSYITLAHELFHAKDYAQFKSTNKKIWYASHSGKITRENELLTCISENRIRAEHGLPLRRYYASYRHSKTGYNPSLIPIYSVLPISVWGKSK